MGPSGEIKRLCCVTGSKSKCKHFNVQPGHPSLPRPIILLQSVHNLLSFFPKASRHRIRFSWLCLASWGCWMENWNKIKQKNANPLMPLWLNWCEIIAPEMLTSNPQWNKKEGLIWMSRLLPADPLLQSYSFLAECQPVHHHPTTDVCQCWALIRKGPHVQWEKFTSFSRQLPKAAKHLTQE